VCASRRAIMMILRRPTKFFPSAFPPPPVARPPSSPFRMLFIFFFSPPFFRSASPALGRPCFSTRFCPLPSFSPPPVIFCKDFQKSLRPRCLRYTPLSFFFILGPGPSSLHHNKSPAPLTGSVRGAVFLGPVMILVRPFSSPLPLSRCPRCSE